MLFNSLQFLVFFAFVLSLYYALPNRARWVLLLLVSCYFYMVFVPAYLLILFAVIGIDYLTAFLINGAQGGKRKVFLGLSLASNLGILFYFKYYNFFLENISLVLNSLDLSNPLPLVYVILPIGLSFHTFQAMSYTIEVYRGRQAPEKHLGIYALYVLFFPQLVAGPIERPQNLLHQFKEQIVYSRNNLRYGLLLMAWGFFKKAVIADRLAEIADHSFNYWWEQNPAGMWLGVIFYSIQIYCDFSGYSDIARGAAKTLGIDLMENFKNPYLSLSITEFWRRWHISLSSWFKDYVYIPMGGSRVSAKKFCRNILIVFLLSGLWHGARYTFLVWGLVHGLFLIAEYFFYKEKEASTLFSLGLKWLYTFLVTTVAWVFFRSQTLEQAWLIIKKLAGFGDMGIYTVFNFTELAFCFILILILLSQEAPLKRLNVEKSSKYYFVLWGLILSSYLFGIYNYKQFIYFQF